MLLTLIKEPFDPPDWIFEPKLDGYRAIAVIDSGGNAGVWSRNHLPLEPKFPTVLEAMNRLKLRSTILDGEIVALDSEGIPRFQLLQKRQKRPTAPVVYDLFDVLFTFCGVRVRTSRPNQSSNDVNGWRRSFLRSTASRWAVGFQITADNSSI
jgi:ATP-dependent DNA ligase